METVKEVGGLRSPELSRRVCVQVSGSRREGCCSRPSGTPSPAPGCWRPPAGFPAREAGTPTPPPGQADWLCHTDDLPVPAAPPCGHRRDSSIRMHHKQLVSTRFYWLLWISLTYIETYCSFLQYVQQLEKTVMCVTLMKCVNLH